MEKSMTAIEELEALNKRKAELEAKVAEEEKAKAEAEKKAKDDAKKQIASDNRLVKSVLTTCYKFNKLGKKAKLEFDLTGKLDALVSGEELQDKQHEEPEKAEKSDVSVEDAKEVIKANQQEEEPVLETTPGAPENDGEGLPNKVLGAIKSGSNDGLTLADIRTATNIADEDIENSLDALLAEGLIYEPIPGKFKVI